MGLYCSPDVMLYFTFPDVNIPVVSPDPSQSVRLGGVKSALAWGMRERVNISSREINMVFPPSPGSSVIN